MTPPTGAPRRRSCLSVPASDPRKVARAATLPADEVVLDLEDAVAPEAKDAARAAVVELLAERGPLADRTTAVRVNAPRTPWCHQDLVAIASAPRPPRSVVVPKVEDAGDLAYVDRLLDGVEAAVGRSTPLRVQALVETATGLARVADVVRASDRLEALVLGYADLGASLGRSSAGVAALDTWLPAQHAVLVAARSAHVQALDGPHLGVADDDPFRTSVRRARDLGFDGKWAIHPGQLPALDEAFTPSAEEERWARRVLEALEAARAGAGAGAGRLDGQMLDEAVAVAARQVLARLGEGG